MHGGRVPDVFYDLVKASAEAGDMEGAWRWLENPVWLDRLQRSDGPTN